ncbi:MAG: TP53 regulating kinase [Chrysothrix sp. TS-e1954]|nr:MAG: TP53 regulating kinase [Chrysothrix sp. TS-e1954]
MAEQQTETTATASEHMGRPSLPATFAETRPQPILIYQGAEALLYKTSFPVSNIDLNADPSPTLTGSPNHQLTTYDAFLKHRPCKPYRHPSLDAKLTKHRILSEARVLLKLRRDCLRCVPAVYAVDWDEGWMIGEWVAGGTVRALLERKEADETSLLRLMKSIGHVVGQMHKFGVVHGDLTTSNLMLRHPFQHSKAELFSGHEHEIVLIDFGLSSQTQADEDRAVDLYVLERAFGSTHPQTERLWEEVLSAYALSYKGARTAVKRLDEVRARGRKKVMIG